MYIFFLLFYPRICPISNYDRRKRHEQLLKNFAYMRMRKKKRIRKGKKERKEEEECSAGICRKR